jgi:uncharacterized protein YciI
MTAIGIGHPAEIRSPDAFEPEAAMRCSYIYFMKDNPDRVAAVAPAHAAYWRGLKLREYLGGPFADRSGGLISFESDSRDDVARLVADDPFVRERLVERSWVKEWKVE